MLDLITMIYISLISLILGFSLESHKLVKTKIAPDITVSIPEELMPMTPEDIAQRHPSVRAPIAAFTDQDRIIDFSIKTSATQWPDVNLEMSAQFFKAGIYNLYDRVDVIDEGIREIHKKQFIYYEFTSRINEDTSGMGLEQSVQKYTYVLYLVEKYRTLVITFSCPQQLQADWQETARAMMSKVIIR